MKYDSLYQSQEIKQTAKIHKLAIFLCLSFVLKQKHIFLSGIATDSGNLSLEISLSIHSATELASILSGLYIGLHHTILTWKYGMLTVDRH